MLDDTTRMREHTNQFFLKNNPKKKDLSSRSRDVRSSNPHIVTSRDEAGQERDNDGD